MLKNLSKLLSLWKELVLRGAMGQKMAKVVFRSAYGRFS